MISLFEWAHYTFVQRAFFVGTFTAAMCATLGVFLVPRRFSMMADGLAHFAFAAVGLALFFHCAPHFIVLPFLLAASLLILRLPANLPVYGDAALGMLSVTGIALGVVLASVGRGLNVDLFSYLFGDILAVNRGEAWSVGIVALIVLGFVATRFRSLMVLTVDPEHARVLGIAASALDRALAVLTALVLGIGLRAVGALLLSSFLIFPVASALQLAASFRSLAWLSALLGIVAAWLGLAAALLWDWPAGASMALANALVFALCVLLCLARRRA